MVIRIKEKVQKAKAWAKEHANAIVTSALAGSVIFLGARAVKRTIDGNSDPFCPEEDTAIEYKGRILKCVKQDLGSDGICFWVDPDDMNNEEN